MDVGAQQKEWAEYANVSGAIASVVVARVATLHELQTVYGVEDLYDLLEIASVETYNKALARQQPEEGNA